MARPAKIISGGQTGVDRAALDTAIALGISHGGWCPRGRLAEDGRVPACYALEETESTEYPARTERNVIDSDATLIVCRKRPSGGTEFTRRVAESRGKPCLVVNLDDPPEPAAVRSWLDRHQVRVLNVAGPRESQSPGVAAAAAALLRALLAE